MLSYIKLSCIRDYPFWFFCLVTFLSPLGVTGLISTVFRLPGHYQRTYSSTPSFFLPFDFLRAYPTLTSTLTGRNGLQTPVSHPLLIHQDSVRSQSSVGIPPQPPFSVLPAQHRVVPPPQSVRQSNLPHHTPHTQRTPIVGTTHIWSPDAERVDPAVGQEDFGPPIQQQTSIFPALPLLRLFSAPTFLLRAGLG